VTIEKSTAEPAVEGSPSLSNNPGLGVFLESTNTALPDGVTAAGDQYDFTAAAVGSGDVAVVGTLTVLLQYDAEEVTDEDDLNVYHYIGGEWTLEETNRTLDAENDTISVEVTSLSPFVVGEGAPASTPATVDGTNGSSGCFISTTMFGN
jgi:hypothetical protein